MTRRYSDILIYGASLALLLFLLKWFEVKFLLYSHSIEVMIGAVAVVFTVLGIWLSSKLTKPQIKTVVVEKEVIVEKGPEFIFNESAFLESGLTERELEVLTSMSLGLSNQEIADKLHLSVPTIKSHASNLFEKLDVKRRTQAVERGKYLKIIP
jgi:DNA-binding NarL/FixJ family response regulator